MFLSVSGLAPGLIRIDDFKVREAENSRGNGQETRRFKMTGNVFSAGVADKRRDAQRFLDWTWPKQLNVRYWRDVNVQATILGRFEE